MTATMDGTIALGDRIRMMSTGAEFEVTRLGAFSPGPVDFNTFGPGEAGFLCASIKTLTDAKVGDTVTLVADPATTPLPGFKEVKPMNRSLRMWILAACLLFPTLAMLKSRASEFIFDVL